MRRRGSAQLPPLLTLCMAGAAVIMVFQLGSIMPLIVIGVAVAISAAILSKVK